MKICILCGHTELYPEEFKENQDSCPMCKADASFIQEVDEDEDEDEDEEGTWKKS